ncbi:uncharacterized protein LOC110677885 [Aedes aegypti]|uniref:Uncharacterized protein n=1 Tax=Aedes aegypti TaxID=7159 RepID=A0A6I8TD10_AEDAE|nr:uncharacterized protein LOC110677885 [Aedes aegypti]
MKYFLLTTIMLGILSYATALSCYKCTSVEDGTCDGKQLVECDAVSAASGMALLLALKPSIQVISSTNYQCYKLVAEQKQSDNGVTIKSCIYDSIAVCEGAPTNAEQKECYTCAEDECNGSGRFGISFMVLLGFFAISWIVGNEY